MKQLFGLFIIAILSCNGNKEEIVARNSYDTVQRITQLQTQVDTTQLEEFFIDSLNIGRRGSNKIELSKYRRGDSAYVILRFFAKRNNKWSLRNEFSFANDGVSSCDPKTGDFNNDRLNDVTYISATGARGANEIRQLFIYDKARDQLVYIRNSESYPNMEYNKSLKCIDAWLIYGGCSTVFLRIERDSLKEFAVVRLDNGLTVTERDSKGKNRVIFQDSANKAGYIRYKNYKPLQESDEQQDRP